MHAVSKLQTPPAVPHHLPTHRVQSHTVSMRHVYLVCFFRAKLGTLDAGWYRVLKQHHTACLHSSSQPAQLTQGVCTPGSSALSDHSAESAIVPFTGTAVNITNRRLFKSTTPPRDQKVLHALLCSGATFFHQHMLGPELKSMQCLEQLGTHHMLKFILLCMLKTRPNCMQQ